MSITNDQLKLVSNLTYIQLLSIDISVELNQHGSLTIEALVDHDDVSCERLLSTDEFTLINKDSNDVLFCGILESTFIEYQDDYKVVTLNCITASKRLDYEKKTRTFQGNTIEEILTTVFTEYGTNAYYNQLDQSPVFAIQYEETDFDFIQRLVSQQHLVVMPNVNDSKTRLYIDIKTKEKEYHVESKDFLRVDNDRTETSFEESYYVFNEHEVLSMGDIIHYDGLSLVVKKIHATIQDGMLTYEYHACQKHYIKRKPMVHRYFAGSGLEGRVLQVENRSLKVHFDIDKTQNPEKAQWIPYGPIGCNAWYTMPHVGTKVMIQFQNSDPSSAIGISLGRKGADDIEDMSNSSNKALTTKWGACFRMTPSTIGFSNDYTELKLGDTIEVRSNDTLRLTADNEMNIGTVTSEYIDASGALVVETKKTKSISIIATELLSLIVVNKAGGMELDKELVLTSLENTECVGYNRKSYAPIVIENDLSELEESGDSEAVVEDKDNGFFSKLKDNIALAAAAIAVASVAIVAAPVMVSASLGTLLIGASLGLKPKVARNSLMNNLISEEFDITDPSRSFASNGVVQGSMGPSMLELTPRYGLNYDDNSTQNIGNYLKSKNNCLPHEKWSGAINKSNLGILIENRKKKNKAGGLLSIVKNKASSEGTGKTGPTIMDAAILAKHVYRRGDTVIPEGWSQTESVVEGALLMGVYYNSNDDIYVIANAGTEPTMGYEPFKDDMVQNIKAAYLASDDVDFSVEFVKDFLKNNPNFNVTYVGHSKGGGEAIMNAVATDGNAIVFNPRRETDLPNSFPGTITSYVVEGEILNANFGQTKGVDVIYLDTQHKAGFFGYYYGTIGDIAQTKAMVDNHGMPSVISALESKLSE